MKNMGYGIHGYVEVQDGIEWEAIHELEAGDIPRGAATQLVFGNGSSTTDCESLFKDRGLPGDISETVREDYMERQPEAGHNGYHRHTFGHSHAFANELPDFLVEKFGPLHDAAQEHEHARLVVWFTR